MMIMRSQCYDKDNVMTMMRSQCYAVVHDRVFVVADTKVLHNQSAHLAISKSTDYDDYNDDKDE